MIARFYVGVFSALRAVQDGPRAISSYFFSLQECSRALQEGFKRLSEGFRVEDAIRNPFWTHFWLQKESSGPQKSLKSLQLSVIVVLSPFSAWTAFGLRFWTLLGSFCIWPPGKLKTVSSVASDRPRADPQLLFGGPEASKSGPRGQLGVKIRTPKKEP